MKLATIAAVALACLALTGCDKRKEQQVAVAVTRGGNPASGVEVRLYPQQQCQGTYEQGVLAADGTIAFSRTVEIGGVGVITDELSVCLAVDGTWKPLFSSLHGPAPGRIDITCDLSKVERQCSTKFDGRPLDEPSADTNDA
jgi:hypothetical protein